MRKGGADINAKDGNGQTPLHIAIINGRVGITGDLIKDGADVNAVDKNNQTPLHHAVINGRVGQALDLIKAKAGVNAKDNDHQTPLHIAAGLTKEELKRNNPGMEDSLINVLVGANQDVVRALITAGADSTAKDKSQKTPLDIAIKKGNKDIEKILRAAELM